MKKNEENSGNSLQQDKYPGLGVARPPHSHSLKRAHTHTRAVADYRVNVFNLTNRPLFVRRKRTHTHTQRAMLDVLTLEKAE